MIGQKEDKDLGYTLKNDLLLLLLSHFSYV